jgi:3-oxosteroid 1-dehydrogenase
MPPGFTPPRARRSGYIRRARTLAELGTACSIDIDGLSDTVAGYNTMCRTGRDTDFGRGGDAYDRYYGDPRVHPNPCMGAIERGPFYAIEIFPGDIGTCGGILTDEHGRALRPDLTPVPRLYATGNCTASVMGRSYPGPGATIGPSSVFGYLAARHLRQPAGTSAQEAPGHRA